VIISDFQAEINPSKNVFLFQEINEGITKLTEHIKIKQ